MSTDGATDKPWAVTPEKIAEAISRLVAAASPQRLILFGSAATSDLASANDLVLLVIQAHVAASYQETVRLHHTLRGLLMPVDLVVTSQKRYEERAQIPGTVEFAACSLVLVLCEADWPGSAATHP